MPVQTEKKAGAIVEGGSRTLAAAHLHPRYWSTWLGIALLSLFWLVPRKLRDKVALLLSRIYLKKDSNHRRYSSINLALCFPHLSVKDRRALLREHYRCFFQVLLDTPLFWWGSDSMVRKVTRVTGQEKAQKAIESGESVIFLVCHSTALDVATTALALEYKMQGFYKPFKNPVIDWLMFRMRSKRGGRLAARGEGFKTVIRDLRKGLTLFYLSDEDFGRAGSEFVPFFGQPKATLGMLSRIAKITSAQVFPVYTHYIPEQGQYQISILPALKDYPSGDAVIDARRLNEATEQSIMICPEQYLWKLRLFKTQEDESELSPYKKFQNGQLDLEL